MRMLAPLLLMVVLAACDEAQLIEGSCTHRQTKQTYPMMYDSGWNHYEGRIDGFQQTISSKDTDVWSCQVDGDPNYTDTFQKEVLDV